MRGIMSYTYVNGCYEITTEIRAGFKRFHRCNAQESLFTIPEDSSNYAVSRWYVWQFISYATPIVQVIRDTKYDTWSVTFNCNPYGYSQTTSRQVNRWIYEHRNVFPFDVEDVRIAIDNQHVVTPDVSVFNCSDINIEFEFRNRNTFDRVWR